VTKLIDDPIYNATLGAAHLSDLLKDWNGSYILTFAAYNAGSGNVRKWITAYGDPRDPSVDPVDWVERIPFSETRNYVQRVMENMQVYRQRFGERTALMTEADLRSGIALKP
jgi:soluble lytic murein transglycosylase